MTAKYSSDGTIMNESAKKDLTKTEVSGTFNLSNSVVVRKSFYLGLNCCLVRYREFIPTERNLEKGIFRMRGWSVIMVTE